MELTNADRVRALAKFDNQRIMPDLANAQTLEAALTTLAFEFYRFRANRRLLSSACNHQRRLCPVSRQAVVYPLLLHFRLLTDFFYGKPMQDDLAASHFQVVPGFDAGFFGGLQ